MEDAETLSLIHDVRYAMNSARILAGYLDRLGREDLIPASGLLQDAADSMGAFIGEAGE